jgi:hypothetical protein
LLRDARSDVALWRTLAARARRLADATPDPADLHRRRLLAAEGLSTLVGPSEHCDLVLEPRRVPFRTVYRVAAPEGSGAPPLSAFERARNRILELSRDVPGTHDGVPHTAQLYWGAVPLIEDGLVRWAIVALEGESAWKAALGLQEAVRRMSGRTVPLSRAFPDLTDAASRQLLVWVVVGDGNGQGLPDVVQSRLSSRPGAQLVTVELDGSIVAVLRNGRSLDALARTFRAEHELYPTARQVR